MRISNFAWLFLLLSSAALSGGASADSLNDVLNSAEMRRITKDTEQGRIDTHSYSADLPKQEGYSRIFIEKDGILLLSKWLGADAGAGIKTLTTLRNKDFIRNTYQIKAAGGGFEAELLVPDPNSRNLIKFGAIKEFSSLEPPGLKIVKSSPVKQKKVTGTLYETSSGDCSVVFRLPHQSLFAMHGPCGKKEALAKSAAQVSLTKLINKLEE